MPGYKCSIKERMLYSSCKSRLLDSVEQDFQLEIAKKVGAHSVGPCHPPCGVIGSPRQGHMDGETEAQGVMCIAKGRLANCWLGQTSAVTPMSLSRGLKGRLGVTEHARHRPWAPLLEVAFQVGFWEDSPGLVRERSRDCLRSGGNQR